MKCRNLVCFLGILLLVSCSTQFKIENIPKTGYKDEFSKTFINFLEVITPHTDLKGKKKIIGIISIKKYVPDFYMVKYSFLNLENEMASVLEGKNKISNHYLYYEGVLYLLRIEDVDLSKFREFDLKENYNRIKITRKNKKEEPYVDRVPFVTYYSMTDTSFLYQENLEWTVAWDWDFEDGWIERFRKRINGELKPGEFPERPKREKEEYKPINDNLDGIEEAKKHFQKILDKEK